MRGVCHAMFAFDIGVAIDLAQAEKLISASPTCGDEGRGQLKRTRRSPQSFKFTPPPLRVALTGEALKIGNLETQRVADVVLFDFGAASITYEIELPRGAALESLVELGSALYENNQIQEDARLRLERMLRE